MGIFGTSSPFDEVVVKATLETNTKEDWALILDICDKVSTSSTAPKECLRAIVRRLNHPDPHVVVQAITLLDACVSNCGLPFHLEVASRDFEQEFCKLIQKIQEKTVLEKLIKCLHKWANNEFKSDPQLDLIPSLVAKLKAKGLEYSSESSHKSKKSSHHRSRDSAASSSSSSAPPVAQEDVDLAKAIELSLKEAKAGAPRKSLYPQANSLSGGGTSSFATEEKEPMKVRALYDFEAAEENELTFYTGEIVFVTDDSDTNWWQGSNQRGKGLFPANFVTTDLSVEPTKLEVSSKKTVQFSEDVEVQSIETEPEVEIDEAKIDKALHMLHEADPTGEVEDPAELAGLEDHVNQMGPLIDQELERIDRRHAQLTRLGGELVDALNMYVSMSSMTPNIVPPGQIHYPQPMPMMNAHGPTMQPQQYESNPMSQYVMGIPPNMPQNGPPQHFGPGSPQVYHPQQSPHSAAPNAPAV